MGNIKALWGGDSGGTGNFNTCNNTDGATGSTYSIPQPMADALEGRGIGGADRLALNPEHVWGSETLRRLLGPFY